MDQLKLVYFLEATQLLLLQCAILHRLIARSSFLIPLPVKCPQTFQDTFLRGRQID